MNRRSITALAAVAFCLGGLAATPALFKSNDTKDAVVSDGLPAWTEVAWPFAPDEWGRGKAFRCEAANCGAQINLYIRAKLGFCNCETGIADDADLDRMGDLYLVGGEVTAMGEGRPIAVGHMTGRSRVYVLAQPAIPSGRRLSRRHSTTAAHDRRDGSVLPHDRPGKTVMRWAEVTLGTLTGIAIARTIAQPHGFHQVGRP